ncbi:glycosyltransferase family 87 protein [Nocardioides sp. BP30]|uniref:glycosyltransferase family 87 protein n=1 Tax=Nocardioides sp. BP30 TaxID=3036374 RepID=UPI002468A64E|nr:glycosyltransferase family 87 protein [Nocardioides sp. BP30]WGL53688.1 glycosyltransferase family 87 protein [Nocardioides sp. BP30]
MRWLGRLRDSTRRIIPSDLLLSLVLIADAIFIVQLWLAHYTNLPAWDEISAPANDGSCWAGADTVTSGSHFGIGVHCFFDYGLNAAAAVSPDPWGVHSPIAVNPYPGLSTAFFLPFVYIGRLFNSAQVSLFVYLALMFVALMVPIIWATRGRPFVYRLTAALALGPLSIPGIITLDRGNSAGFLPIGVWLACMGIAKDRKAMTVVGIVLAVAIKPQMAGIVLILLLLRRWGQAAVTIAIIGLAELASYALIWHDSFPDNLKESWKVITSFGDVTRPDRLGASVSLRRVVDLGVLTLRKLFGDHAIFDRLATHAMSTGPALLVLLVALLVLAALMRRGFSPLVGVVYLAVLGAISPGWAPGYYGAIGVAAAAVVMRDEPWAWRRRPSDSAVSEGAPRVVTYAVVIATAATLTRLLYPYALTTTGLPQGGFVKSTAWATPVAWTAALLVLIVASAMSMLRRSRDPEPYQAQHRGQTDATGYDHEQPRP